MTKIDRTTRPQHQVRQCTEPKHDRLFPIWTSADLCFRRKELFLSNYLSSVFVANVSHFSWHQSYCLHYLVQETKLTSLPLFSLNCFSSRSFCSELPPVSWYGDQIADKPPTVTYTLAWLNWPLLVHLLKSSLCWMGGLCSRGVEEGRDGLWVYCCHVCLSLTSPRQRS